MALERGIKQRSRRRWASRPSHSTNKTKKVSCWVNPAIVYSSSRLNRLAVRDRKFYIRGHSAKTLTYTKNGKSPPDVQPLQHHDEQAAIIALFRVINRYVGNLAPMPGVFPDYPAPVVRNTDTGRELSMMRWGMPSPPRTGEPPVTNIRNTSSRDCAHCRLDSAVRLPVVFFAVAARYRPSASRLAMSAFSSSAIARYCAAIRPKVARFCVSVARLLMRSHSAASAMSFFQPSFQVLRLARLPRAP